MLLKLWIYLSEVPTCFPPGLENNQIINDTTLLQVLLIAEEQQNQSINLVCSLYFHLSFPPFQTSLLLRLASSFWHVLGL